MAPSFCSRNPQSICCASRTRGWLMSMIWSSLALNRSFWPFSCRSLGFIPSPYANSASLAAENAGQFCKKIDRGGPRSCEFDDQKIAEESCNLSRLWIVHGRLLLKLPVERLHPCLISTIPTSCCSSSTRNFAPFVLRTGVRIAIASCIGAMTRDLDKANLGEARLKP